jgi:hypothetical protein
MKSVNKKLVVALAATSVLLTVSAFGQIHRYFSPGTVWTVTMIKVKAGMDPAYLQFLDTDFKKEMDTMVKANFMKSYKVLRSMDDDDRSWNVLLLEEFPSLASMEANEEKADKLVTEVMGMSDQKQMEGYQDRSKIREVLGIRTTRELILK